MTPGVSPALTDFAMPEFVGGCCLECELYVEHIAKDPDSIECVRSTIPVVEGPSWTTTMVFRGKNSFGAKVLNQKKFYLQNNRVVDMK